MNKNFLFPQVHMIPLLLIFVNLFCMTNLVTRALTNLWMIIEVLIPATKLITRVCLCQESMRQKNQSLRKQEILWIKLNRELAQNLIITISNLMLQILIGKMKALIYREQEGNQLLSLSHSIKLINRWWNQLKMDAVVV